MEICEKVRIVEENISIEEWERHFLELLEGKKGTDEETGGGPKGRAKRGGNRNTIKEDKKEKNDRD